MKQEFESCWPKGSDPYEIEKAAWEAMKPVYKPHQSQRGFFAYELHKQMGQNNNIWLITADLGYGMFDRTKEDYPERFLNVGAAEQTAVGAAVGLALSGAIPFVYSITPFLLFRPYETIRNYIDHEKIPVRLVGGGRDKDYIHDGFSHWAEDIYEEQPGHNNLFWNIPSLWPENKEEIPEMVERMVKEDRPWFISLKR